MNSRHTLVPVLLVAMSAAGLAAEPEPPAAGNSDRGPCPVTHRFLKGGWKSKGVGIVRNDLTVEWEQPDMCSKEATAEYAENLVNLVKDIRAEFQSPDLPVAVGELGNGGPAKEGSGMEAFRAAQKGGDGEDPQRTVRPAQQCARPAELSPNCGHGHHWFGNAESYFLVGDALG